MTNPFIEREQIVDPERFTGRWAELSQIFERLEAGRPVLISGVPKIGKSSLLNHIVQSAAVNLEIPELRGFYLDLVGANSSAAVYETVIRAMGGRGDTASALEIALIERGDPVLLCLDNAQAAFEQPWGEILLEALARIVRGGLLMLVVAMTGRPPTLSERFAYMTLGAMGPPEVRLMTEAYLDATNVRFTPAELNEISRLSTGHPAYIQRAAYHLFEHKQRPDHDWRAAYLAEARDMPVPGAPLPPGVFEGQHQGQSGQATYNDLPTEQAVVYPQLAAVPNTSRWLLWLIPFAVAFVVMLFTQQIVFAALAAGLIIAGLLLLMRSLH
jgi:hypothetical protein